MPVHEQPLPLSLDGLASEPAVERLTQQIEAERRSETTRRTRGGAMMVGASAVIAAGVLYAQQRLGGEHLTWALPFVKSAQEAVNGIDDVLVPVGGVALPLAVAAIGVTKLAAAHNSTARFADSFSAREPSSDGQRHSRLGRFTRRVGMAAAGAALATFTSSIATEVTSGPERTIDAFGNMLPGDAVVVQYEGAMPMVTSAVNPDLQAKITREAAGKGIRTHTFRLSLGTYEYGGERRTHLIAGIEVPDGSPLDWRSGKCDSVPIILDTSSGIGVGEHPVVNGITTTVVGTTEGASSMNRTSGLMDEQAVAACLQQDVGAPNFGMTLETDPETAQGIIDGVRGAGDGPAVAISREQFAKNSEEFWAANVQPITNVLNLAAGAMAFMAMTSAMGARLLRNRRELAAKLADRTKSSTIRIAELVRSAKDGLLATAVGVTTAVPVTIGANALESGFKAGVGVREALIGSALGLAGTVGGAALSLIGLRRVADPDHNTRA